MIWKRLEEMAITLAEQASVREVFGEFEENMGKHLECSDRRLFIHLVPLMRHPLRAPVQPPTAQPTYLIQGTTNGQYYRSIYGTPVRT